MDICLVEACFYAVLLLVCCGLVQSEPICDQTEFLHPNGTCVACPACVPGEELSEDCGFGDGGEGVCIPCEERKFSTETGVTPCRTCTQCSLLNRLEETACSPTSDSLCGHCLPGYYELRSMTGEVELLCLPCYSHDTIHTECLLLTSKGFKAESTTNSPKEHFRDPEEKRVKEETFSVVLIVSATASLIFLLALLLWGLHLTAEKFKQVPVYASKPEGILSAADLQHTPLFTHTDRAAQPEEAPSQIVSAENPTRGLYSVSHENWVHPTSIVINVTTNIKPSSQNTDSITQEQQSLITQEMERQLQDIWEIAEGQRIEMLDYDSVQDLSILLDSADNIKALRRLAQSLGVPPQIIPHIQGFQELFQYLRTSTYTLLPQLAQAAALLPNSEVVKRIHRAVVKQ
ncbi:tumor necrosis factor receptor superfamily member 19-like [Astatotilapia calliptera]|uniref:tumor necrosis factor receptor superfamily member 19-like n=1 Tax=Astatotilapia calliptera TaxID=8154 RepID=UPI000E419DEC|nr:tumor necrosis factor receptor superfamily member 19-like [Astatotilapia calliptera]